MRKFFVFAGKSTLMASTAGLALGLAAPAVSAQEAPAQPAASSSSELGMGEIIVTARKRGESLVDVPVAITAMTGEGLAARGVQGLNDLNAFVPGLRYQNSAANRNDRSFTTITMRGMYPGDSPNRQAVTIFVDGVAIPGGSTSGLTDIERVEVVKGPQSANFGRATFGGAINFITRAPATDEVKGSVDVSYESYNTAEVKASVEGPLVEDKLGVRLSGRYYHTDGQYDNVGFSGKLGERDTRQVAASFIAHPTDALTVRGYATYWEDSDGPTAQALLGEESYNCNLGGNARVPVGSTTGF
ncbi:MAG TPA: TonB-dependent receptor plug domain-containing protein, partial [Pedomonas sp.]|uniref:TonB-dependent receptor n=1 Tax=Pedomonas sp. TaxID=2976421 RepID=UPI002F4153D3